MKSLRCALGCHRYGAIDEGGGLWRLLPCLRCGKQPRPTTNTGQNA